jgi:hypothetical protein
MSEEYCRSKEIEEAVHRTLTSLGFDTTDPIQNQKNMLFLKELMQRQELYRKTCVSIVISGIMAGIGYALKILFDSVVSAYR